MPGLFKNKRELSTHSGNEGFCPTQGSWHRIPKQPVPPGFQGSYNSPRELHWHFQFAGRGTQQSSSKSAPTLVFIWTCIPALQPTSRKPQFTMPASSKKWGGQPWPTLLSDYTAKSMARPCRNLLQKEYFPLGLHCLGICWAHRMPEALPILLRTDFLPKIPELCLRAVSQNPYLCHLLDLRVLVRAGRNLVYFFTNVEPGPRTG